MRLEGELWDAINRYATSVGGDPSNHVYGNVPRMQAVVDVGAAIGKLVEQQHVKRHDAATQPSPTNPDCTGTVGKDFAACGEEGYYCSDRCWTIGRLGAARARVAEYERQLVVCTLDGAGGDMERGET
jgi:hypothetical protein